MKLRWMAGAACLAMTAALADEAPQEAPWEVAGRQGIVRNVIVPAGQARDREAYAKQIQVLCGAADQSCFLNFYTNSTGVPLAMPLPDAILNEPTAVFRRSTKQGAELFRWSCRAQPGSEGCF